MKGWSNDVSDGRARDSDTPTLQCSIFHSCYQQTRPFKCRQKIFFDLGETASGNGRPRDQDEFQRLGQFMLMLAEAFAEQTPRAAACHRAADFTARDDPKPGRRPVRQPVPVGNQATLRQSLALLPHPREIPILAKA